MRILFTADLRILEFMLPHVAAIRLYLLLYVGRYPLAVKLGTITPNGADVYSYAPEEDNMVKVCSMLICFSGHLLQQETGKPVQAGCLIFLHKLASSLNRI